ncbi:MAG: hypothetical protein SFW36_20260 [Leptolyngbyaceae cyanobacterium bins.59]|nr:hypothetical protein [Leptolyngbyaceae cyanobacterium bins.59]
MIPPINLLPTAFSELFLSITNTKKITLADRYGMLAALLREEVTLEERQVLDRLLYALRRGQVQLVNELSIAMG